MNESEFQTKLAELMGEITTLPQTERKKLEKLANETRERHERLRQTVSSLQEPRPGHEAAGDGQDLLLTT